ncbi:hypothetical protein [Clostridium sp. BNL1100]|uniref:hypothetical protein n=1 Tax=Clostridium sp. BNL1100 TaxID=755731 RepID=UPI00024A7AAC|nr:hypothetical protein [Clostridium sp. BNL1100]AEY67000.1 hypothetical protein Clo1100_2847 [Clostridium sp. BNL1100]
MQKNDKTDKNIEAVSGRGNRNFQNKILAQKTVTSAKAAGKTTKEDETVKTAVLTSQKEITQLKKFCALVNNAIDKKSSTAVQNAIKGLEASIKLANGVLLLNNVTAKNVTTAQNKITMANINAALSGAIITAEKALEKSKGLLAGIKSFEDFLKKLADHESSGDYKVVNGLGYLGKYQMGELALADAGFYYEKVEKGAYRVDGDNNFEGMWSDLANKYNVFSKKDFLNNEEAQETAFLAFLAKVWGYIKPYKKHIGETKCGVYITASGLLAGAHLLGPKGVAQLFGGKKVYPEDKNGVPVDGNKTPITVYIKDMGGHDLTPLLGYNPDKS